MGVKAQQLAVHGHDRVIGARGRHAADLADRPVGEALVHHREIGADVVEIELLDAEEASAVDELIGMHAERRLAVDGQERLSSFQIHADGTVRAAVVDQRRGNPGVGLRAQRGDSGVGDLQLVRGHDVVAEDAIADVAGVGDLLRGIARGLGGRGRRGSAGVGGARRDVPLGGDPVGRSIGLTRAGEVDDLRAVCHAIDERAVGTRQTDAAAGGRQRDRDVRGADRRTPVAPQRQEAVGGNGGALGQHRAMGLAEIVGHARSRPARCRCWSDCRARPRAQRRRCRPWR